MRSTSSPSAVSMMIGIVEVARSSRQIARPLSCGSMRSSTIEVEAALRERAARFGAVADGGRAQPVLLEEVPQQRADLAVVIDDQNVGGVGHGRAAVTVSGLVRPRGSRDHAASLRLKRGVGCNRMLRTRASGAGLPGRFRGKVPEKSPAHPTNSRLVTPLLMRDRSAYADSPYRGLQAPLHSSVMGNSPLVSPRATLRPNILVSILWT